jgi:hypothetical protein
MIKWIASKFTKHNYQYVGTSSTHGTYYKCVKCGKKYYVPLDWSYLINVKTVKGCTVSKKAMFQYNR